MEEKISLFGATVPFFKKEQNGGIIYRFDSSDSSCPKPMINAMVGLQKLNDNDTLVMINSVEPKGLYPKIEEDFEYTAKKLTNGKMEIIFRKKGDGSHTDFDDKHCSG